MTSAPYSVRARSFTDEQKENERKAYHNVVVGIEYEYGGKELMMYVYTHPEKVLSYKVRL